MLDHCTRRLAALDGLRAISILLVLSAHMLPIGPKSWEMNLTIGAMGMSLFFALSGFLITTQLLAGQSAPVFFVRRFTRILPLAYLYLAVVFLVVTYDLPRLGGSLLFLENYHFQFLSDLNGHFWSLCVEMHFYLAIGIVVACLGRRAAYLVIPACLFITAIRVYEGNYVSIETHLRVDEILAGGCVGVLFHRKLLGSRINQFWLTLPVSLWLVSSHPESGALQYIRPYCSASILATAVMLKPGYISSLLQSSASKYIADVSFALYVIHPLTTHGWMNDGSSFERYFVKRPFSFIATFILAHLSTFYYERRCSEIGKKIINMKYA
jgi:peptidoglycan/LPS O-acetylase OafA/YrhL